MWRWLIVVVLIAGCSRALPPCNEPADAEDPEPAAGDARIKELEGGWVLNRVWEGYMGVAIQFRPNGTFDYWFYSDVPEKNAPTYPVHGSWKRDGAVLQLESEHRLHATRWHVCQHQGETCLLPKYAWEWQQDDGQARDDRALFRIANFDPARPFDNRR
jgi:hypothetical protein